MRGIELDPEDRALLDQNIAEAEAAYQVAGDFETQARALSGWREAILHRLDAVKAPDAISTRLVVTYPGSEPGEGTPIAMRPGDYWRQVPSRFHDPSRFRVERVIRMRYAVVSRQEGDRDVEIKVRDQDGLLVWAGDR
jgi:hypothetical protein